MDWSKYGYKMLKLCKGKLLIISNYMCVWGRNDILYKHFM